MVNIRKPGVYWTRTTGNSWHDLSYWDGFEWQVPDEDQKLTDADLDDIIEEAVEKEFERLMKNRKEWEEM